MTTTPATRPGLLEIDTAVAAFRRDGYVIQRGLFGGDELEALREEAAAQIAAGPARGPAAHFPRGRAADGREVLFRIEAVAQKAIRNDSALLAAVHPDLLGLALAIVGGPAVWWADTLLWKGPEGGAAVAMHSSYGWNSPTVGIENMVVDVYLDEATPENGCLQVIPGSHLLDPDENRGLVAKGFDQDGLVDVIMQPGDVLFHSEWMVHGSRPTGPLPEPTRRIFYYGFRDPIAFAPPGSDGRRHHRIARCLRRMHLAQERRSEATYAGDEVPVPIPLPDRWPQEVVEDLDDSEAYAIGFYAEIGNG